MQKRILLIWFLVSLASIAAGLLWRSIDSQNSNASLVYTYGWLSSLLAVGYYSTPSGTIFGKIAFAAVCILVTGIAMKVFGIAGANQVIIGALLTIGITYAKMWLKDQKASRN
jgi:hypothetical protein